MLPFNIPENSLLGKLLQSSPNGNPKSGNSKSIFKLSPNIRRAPPKKSTAPKKSNISKNFAASNPLQALLKGLTSTISTLTKKTPAEDYNAVVRGFIPGDAKLLRPQLPLNSKEIHFADIDGDSHNELITSYKANNELKTLILKKQDGRWHKLGEISTPGYDTVSYRNAVDVTGKGRKQLLLGMSSKDKGSSLHGYSYENNSINPLFTRNYNWLEVLNTPAGKDAPAKAQLAIWEKKDFDHFDIDVHHWNGQTLEPTGTKASYYNKRVVPFYVNKVKKGPVSASSWYNLADALAKTGAKRESLEAINVGTMLTKDPAFKDRFVELKNRI